MFSGKCRFFFLIAALVLLALAAVSACADDLLFPIHTENAVVVDRAVLGVKKGTKLPVYGAPFDDAWRGAKGKAAVSTSEPFGVLDTAQDGQWLMITYSVDKKSGRIGWIRRPEKMTEQIQCRMTFRLPYKVTRDTVLTDDPEKSRREIRTLRAGETVIAMYTLTAGDTEWIYLETDVEGQPVWGFAESDALESVPAWYLEGDRLRFMDGVSCVGLSDFDQVTVKKGEIWSIAIDFYEDCGKEVREIVLPASMERIYPEAFYYAGGVEIRLPGTLKEASGDAFTSGHIRRVILEKDYTGGIIGGEHWVIDAWEVEPGNPLYSSRDGVLFSADGKTLLAYPNGKEQAHYDVPAGTEEIADMAFYDDDMSIPLQTVSLPIGLKRIGALAFCGCGRLHSLAVPLTVTDLAENAFAYCVSLERLSLPPGLAASFSGEAALKEDFSRFSGDNGVTLSARRDAWGDEEEENIAPGSFRVWITGENGEGTVNIYPSADAAEPSGKKPSGTGDTVIGVTGRRAFLGRTMDGEEWVDLENILPCGYATFFDYYDVDAVPTAEGLKELARQGLSDYGRDWFNEDEMEVVFSSAAADPDGGGSEAALPVSLVTLYRPRTGDSRTLGFLYAPEQETPVRIYDAPDGSPAAWSFRSEQAEVLAREGGWLKIRTASAEGWISEENLIVVPQKPET